MKYFLILLSILFVIISAPSISYAQGELTTLKPCEDQTPKPSYCLNDNISQLTAAAVQFVFVIAVIISLGFLIYGGVKWITSGGDKGGVEGARNMIIAAIIGLIVVFLAYVILNLVLIFLTGSGLNSITFRPLVPNPSP